MKIIKLKKNKKQKRGPLSEKQLQALAKGREKMKLKREDKKKEKELLLPPIPSPPILDTIVEDEPELEIKVEKPKTKHT